MWKSGEDVSKKVRESTRAEVTMGAALVLERMWRRISKNVVFSDSEERVGCPLLPQFFSFIFNKATWVAMES